ncbi:HAD family phosphatase [Methylosinus sporium]|uniref:HAD family phosphatase n=1 Tax=Methylosinus sporium TaxID=428 RepID=A0A549SWF1_METSR|nr:MULTISPECIES: HAD family phosphatase [Methylosinus]MBU3888377.1 HAD family phosphatase [Methylosinus sp. KRF6]TRL33956.1 HAD family phosphatase [Methylosinus sporium]
MIKAILFDMDGVLIEAKDWHYDALNDVLGIFGMAIDYDAHLATFDGLPTRRKLEILSKSRGFPHGLHDFVNRLKQGRTVEITTAKCRPLFQHRFALSRLKRDNLKLAVCSNSVRQTVELMMRLSNLEPFLDLMVSNEDVKKAKPDPEMYRYAIGRFGLQPHEVLILEDNDHGIAAARASGAHLMIIGTVEDVRYDKIREAIEMAERLPIQADSA